MRPQEMIAFLQSAFKNGVRVLISGAPGIGKSDIVAQACQAIGADLILSHPAVSDPTDIKGLPWIVDGKADFLPFGDLRRAMDATKPTVWFLDDLGQASPAVQAGVMQPLQAREVNGKRISDHVVFCAATNRRTDKAGVSGILEPVKSRFDTIVELEPHVDDFCRWAIDHDFTSESVAFFRFRTDLLCNFKATNDLTNSPTPRTWANAEKLIKLGLSDALLLQALTGAVGEGAAVERIAFARMVKALPSIDQILIDPRSVEVPDQPAVLYALATALAHRATVTNFERIGQYVQRMVDAGRAEFGVLTLKDALQRNRELHKTQAFVRLATGELGTLIHG